MLSVNAYNVCLPDFQKVLQTFCIDINYLYILHLDFSITYAHEMRTYELNIYHSIT